MKLNHTLPAIALITLSSHASAQSYASYSNERFGFTLSYPGDFKMDPPPANGDGGRFTNALGISITASGSNNALEDSISTKMEALTPWFDSITYRAKGKNWFVLSGFKGKDVLYMKVFVGKGSINQLWIQHPATLTKTFAAATARIVSSFKPGDLTETF